MYSYEQLNQTTPQGEAILNFFNQTAELAFNTSDLISTDFLSSVRSRLKLLNTTCMLNVLDFIF